MLRAKRSSNEIEIVFLKEKVRELMSTLSFLGVVESEDKVIVINISESPTHSNVD